MKHTLLVTTLVVTTSLFGQITIDQNDFPGADDTAMISVSDETTLDLMTTGPNSSWNFTDLHIESQRIDTFFNPADASGLYQLQFNNVIFEPEYASDYYFNLVGFDLAGASGAGITIEKPVGFVKITGSEVQNVGMGLVLNGYEVPMAMDTIDTEFMLPMNYTDAWTSSSYLYVDLNPAFNGIFIRYQDRTSEVDGWGEITTRFGTFDVLRVKSQLTFVDSVYVDFGVGGTWIELPTPPQNEYTWWSNDNKVPILRVTTQDIGGDETVTKVEFKDMERNLAGVEENLDFAGTIYPNPANKNINIRFEQGVSGMSIFSITGEKIMQHQVTGPYLDLDVSGWAPGIYLVKLVSENGVSEAKLIVQ
jgi:hypothetical protein